MTKNKFGIMLDCDDCINTLVEHWVNNLNYIHNLNVKYEDIRSWQIAEYFPTLEEKEVYAPIHENKFWISMPVKKDAQTYVDKLLDDGHKITIVTASNYKTISTKVEWILEKFPRLTWEDIIITSQKQRIRGDIIIDDGEHNLTDNPCIKILFDMPHNKSCNNKSIQRVYNWQDCYNYISNLVIRDF